MRLYSFLLLLACCLASGVASPEATGKGIHTVPVLTASGMTGNARWDMGERRLSAPASVPGEYHNAPDTDSAGRNRHPGITAWPGPAGVYSVAGIFTAYGQACRPQSHTAVFSLLRSLIYPKHSFW